MEEDTKNKQSNEDATPPPELATYSGGECPILVDGRNEDFLSAGLSREFLLALPENPEGSPVVFGWHWLGGNATQAMEYLGLNEMATMENMVIVAPESDGSPYEWHSMDAETDNPDLILFDDILTCLHAQENVNTNAVYTTGMSAGGIWSSYLLTYRAHVLAAAAPLSGGVYADYYVTPTDPIPVMLTWGGPSDVYSTFSFDVATEDFSAGLQEDDHFVVECEHDGGHTIPDGVAEYVWRFFADHPRGTEETYENGLPEEFPDWCRLPN